MRTIKEDLLWLQEGSCVDEVASAQDRWVEEYYNRYLYSALGLRTSNQTEQAYNPNHGFSYKPLDRWGAGQNCYEVMEITEPEDCCIECHEKK